MNIMHHNYVIQFKIHSLQPLQGQDTDRLGVLLTGPTPNKVTCICHTCVKLSYILCYNLELGHI